MVSVKHKNYIFLLHHEERKPVMMHIIAIYSHTKQQQLLQYHLLTTISEIISNVRLSFCNINLVFRSFSFIQLDVTSAYCSAKVVISQP